MIDRIDKDVKTAMKSGDAVRRDALRLVLSSLRDAEKTRAAPAHRRRGAGRPAARAQAPPRGGQGVHTTRGTPIAPLRRRSEAELIEGYLPAQLPDSDLDTIVESAIAKVGAKGLGDMGQVMREAMALAAGRADGKRVQERVRARLAE